MEAANTLSTLIIFAGWAGALIWSLSAAWRGSGWRAVVHGLNAVLMLAGGFLILRGLAFGMLVGVLLLVTSTLVVRIDKSDPFRWLLMVQLVFALFLASGAPFRNG